MGFFNNFPYTNSHELNLDWVIRTVINVENGLKNMGEQNEKYQEELNSKIENTIKIEVQKLLDEKDLSSVILDYVSANLNGFTPENPNVDKLNELIATGKTVYVGSGEYLINKPIILTRKCKLIFDGTVNSLGLTRTFEINGNETYLYIRSMIGVNVGDAILVKAENDTVGNVIINAPYIGNYNTAIHCYSNNGVGIQNIEANLNRIDNVLTGIHLECGDNGLNWINQNTFTSFWISSPDVVGACGIRFTKGAEQTDRFNGNTFTEFSCENCNQIINIDFAWNNSFDGFRFLENYGERSIVCTNTCESNEFRCVSAYTSINYIEDSGINNDYLCTVSENGLNVSEHFTFNTGHPIPLDDLVPSIITESGNIDYYKHITIIRQTDNTPLELSLPLKYSVDIYSPPFILLETKTGLIVIKSWNGTILATNGGSYPTSTAGILLEENSKYLLYLVSSNNWGAVKLG